LRPSSQSLGSSIRQIKETADIKYVDNTGRYTRPSGNGGQQCFRSVSVLDSNTIGSVDPIPHWESGREYRQENLIPQKKEGRELFLELPEELEATPRA
jgi:hypothetical protein